MPYGSLIFLSKSDYGRLIGSEHEKQLLNWLKSLGVDTDITIPRLRITSDSNHEYRLHVSQYVKDERSNYVQDYAKGEASTVPLVVELGKERNWPEFLNQYQAAPWRGTTFQISGKWDSELDLK